MFDTVLVANRGEIAVRVIRTLRALGIRSVAVYSDADADAPHVRGRRRRRPDRAGAGRAVYLSIEAVIAAARATGAQAIHPGYGFLSENPAFAAACDGAGIVFVGPPAAAIEAMGDKIRAKQTVAAAGVPVVPGCDRSRAVRRRSSPRPRHAIGFPVLLKPSAGGGGKGMRLVHDARRPARPRSRRPAARRAARSATTRCSSSGSSPPRGTSRSRCSPTRTATSSTSASASAACSAATRRSSRRRRRRC